ncbi:MAG: motility associated factor glycosyltransferase family protein [Spirochaetes bacterium]|nr:motility associated factor glycosyltransferase family protein [Spirochaetota bacterium]
MLKNNLECNWQILKSKDNHDILIINNKYIHSKISPLNEADNFIHQGKNLIIIFGIGLAYHIKNIIKNNYNSYFIIYEPYKEIYDFINKSKDNDFLYNSPNICTLNLINYNKIFNFINSNVSTGNLKFITYSNLGYKSLLPAIESEYYKSVKQIYELHIKNLLTESNFIPLWSKNFLFNSSMLNKIPVLLPVKKIIDNNLLVIIGAGPSMMYDIDIIKKLRGKITVFAVDTAVKPLLNKKIIPDCIITLDSQYYTINDFIKNIPEESYIFADIICYPEIAKIYKNIYFTIANNLLKDTLLNYFFKINNINIYGMNTGGTVSDYALSLAILLGYKNIYFSGLDLSYPYLQTHASGTPFYEKNIIESDYIKTMQSKMINNISERELSYEQSKIKDKKILTDFVLKSYAFYLTKFIEEHNDINFYTNTHYGLKIENMKEINLSDLIENSNYKKIVFTELINNSNLINIDKNKLKKFYKNLSDNLYNDSKIINNYIKSTDFASDDDSILKDISLYYNYILNKYPFLKKFTIMTELILEKKNINENLSLWYKHIFHKMIQSIFYLIRINQKLLKIL